MLLRLRQLLHGLPLHLLRHDEQHPNLLLRVLKDSWQWADGRRQSPTADCPLPPGHCPLWPNFGVSIRLSLWQTSTSGATDMGARRIRRELRQVDMAASRLVNGERTKRACRAIAT